MSKVVSYSTSPEKMYEHHGALSRAPLELPYKSGTRIFSQLSQNMELIQNSTIAIALPLLSLATVPILSPLLLGSSIVFVAYKLYRAIFCKDELEEAFFKICGGKENFENLPSIPSLWTLGSDIKDKLNFLEASNSASFPMYQGWLVGCRRVLVIKGTENKLLVFVEKLSPFDFINMPLSAKIVFLAKMLLPFSNNPRTVCVDNIEFSGSMSTDRANAIFLQNKYKTVDALQQKIEEHLLEDLVDFD